MTQKKRIASKLFLLVLVMTLISCCFLGSTFARYTSGASGTGTLSVAKWDIDFNDAAGTDTSLNVTFDTLSPSQKPYVDTARTNSTGKVKVAKISNNGVVNALVTLTAGTVPTLSCNSAYGSGVTDNGIPTEAECKEVFTINWYTNTSDDKATATAYTQSVELAPKGVLYVYAEVIWTSDVVGGLSGDDADIRDTWMGENVTGASWTLNCTAVQNSEKP